MKPNRVEQLQASGRSYARAWKEFIKAYSKNPDCFFCFYEGKDDPRYYGVRIRFIILDRLTDSSSLDLWCDGKDNLLKLFELVTDDPRYEEAWLAFFIDKDFDELGELPSDRRLYITPCYAVENFYLTQATFERILRKEFGLSEIAPDFEPTVTLYKNLLANFNAISVELNAWIYLQKLRSKESGSKSKLNLKSVPFNKLFSVRIDQVQKLYSIDDLETFFPGAISITEHDINQQLLDFQKVKNQWTCVFRGKYLISFLRKFLMCLVKDSNSRKNRQHFSKRNKVNLHLSENTISELSQYADTPNCLRKFLENQLATRTRQLSIDGFGSSIVK